MALMSATCYAQTKVELSTPGSLSTLLTDAQKDTCRSLVVTGKLNSADIRTLRQMAGYGEGGGKLENLDLRNAGFVSDDSPYQTLDAEKDCVVATFMSTRYYSNVLPEENIHYGSGGANGGLHTTNAYGDAATYEPLYIIFGKEEKDTIEFKKENIVDFSAPLTGKDKRRIDAKNMKRFKGHRLSETDGRYYITCSTKKNMFCFDMFYRCPSLKAVALPYKVKINDQIAFYNDGIRYYLFNEADKDKDVQPVTVYHKYGKTNVSLRNTARLSEM